MRDTRTTLNDADRSEILQLADANPSHNFRLRLVQQPEICKAAPNAAKGTKWPVEPPPVLELTSPEQLQSKWLYIHNPNWFCVAVLIPIETREKSTAKAGKTSSTENNLHGLLASSLHKMRNQDDKLEHGYFVFGDLNIKRAGRYKFDFTLFEIRRSSQEPGSETLHAARIDSIQSNEFEVFQGAWPANAPKNSTKLSRALNDCGIKIRLRKESTKRKQPAPNWSSKSSDLFNYNNQILSGRNTGEDLTGRLSVSQSDINSSSMPSWPSIPWNHQQEHIPIYNQATFGPTHNSMTQWVPPQPWNAAHFPMHPQQGMSFNFANELPPQFQPQPQSQPPLAPQHPVTPQQQQPPPSSRMMRSALLEDEFQHG